MKISDFKPNAAWKYNTDGLQILDASGGTFVCEYDDEEYDAIFSYFTKDNLKSCPEAGWYLQEPALDGDWISIEDVDLDTLPYGFGVVYETSSNEAGLVFSGAVADEPQTIIASKSGWNLIGNPTPVPVSFADITPNAAWKYNTDGLQILDASGGTFVCEYDDEEYDAIFSYFTKDNLKSCPAAGWYLQEPALDGDWISIEDVGLEGLAAGEAVVFETSSNAAGVQFPAAISK